MDKAQYGKYIMELFTDAAIEHAIDVNAEGTQLLHGECENQKFLLTSPVIFRKPLSYGLNMIEEYLNDGKDDLPMNMRDVTGIYFILNVDNNKMYVGQSVSVFTRSRQHFEPSDDNHGMYDDYKSGDTFVINFIPCSREDLDKTERYYIDKFDCVKNGYNRA